MSFDDTNDIAEERKQSVKDKERDDDRLERVIDEVYESLADSDPHNLKHLETFNRHGNETFQDDVINEFEEYNGELTDSAFDHESLMADERDKPQLSDIYDALADYTRAAIDKIDEEDQEED